MKVRCSGCRAKYRVPDENVESTSARITCKRCGARLRIAHLGASVEGGTIVEGYAGAQMTAEHRVGIPTETASTPIPRQVSMPPPPLPELDPVPPPDVPSSPGPNERSFYVNVGGQTRGPYRAGTLVDLVCQNKLDASTWACPKGTEDWIPIAQIKELSGLLAGQPMPKAAPPSPPTVEAPRDNNPTAPKIGDQTRMVLMDAGVLGREEKHSRWGKSAAALAAGMIFGFLAVGGVGWWFWIQRPAQEKQARQERRIVLTFDDEAMAGAADEYAFLLAGKPPPEVKEPRAKPKKRKRRQKPKKSGDGTKSSDEETAGEVREQLGGGLIGEKERAQPVESKEKALVEQAGGLETDAVREVYKRNAQSLAHCVEQAQKTGTLIAGKHSAVLGVQVSGKVETVKVGGRLRGSELGGCIAKTLRRWRFPAFAGGTTDVEIPLVLGG